MEIVEHGSSIEYDPLGEFVAPAHHEFMGRDRIFFGSGRQALIALARTLLRTTRLRRIVLPDHYCHATTHALATAVAETGGVVELYPATFGDPIDIATESSDLVVMNAAFGVMPDWSVTGAGTRVLDATHAPDLAIEPESNESPAGFDYVFASLKKLLPVTDGGILRTLRPHVPMPPRPRQDPDHEDGARELEGLLHLKKRYVEGEDVNKADFYPAIKELELRLTRRRNPCAMSEVAMRQLRTIDIAAAVGTARRNVEYVRGRLHDALSHLRVPAVQILETKTFVALLCTDAATKQSLVERLIGHRIYPATLWPTDGVAGISIETQDFVDRLVVLNADLRYLIEHMASVSDLVIASICSLDRSSCAR